MTRYMLGIHPRCTGYTPENTPMEGGQLDCHGNPLHTLQDFLTGSADFVSVAADKLLKIPYGAPLCIPAFDRHYGTNIKFRVVDHGGDFVGAGWSHIDICTADQKHANDAFLNNTYDAVVLLGDTNGAS